jgi:hypothetical protein
MIANVVDGRVCESNSLLKEISVTGLARMFGRTLWLQKMNVFCVEVFEGQFEGRRRLSMPSEGAGAGRIVEKYRFLDSVKGVAKQLWRWPRGRSGCDACNWERRQEVIDRRVG